MPTREAFNTALREKLLELELPADEVERDYDLPYEMLNKALPQSVGELKDLLDQFECDEIHQLSSINRRAIDPMRHALLEWAQLSIDPQEPLYKNLTESSIKEIASETIGLTRGRKRELLDKMIAVYGVFDVDTPLPNLSATEVPPQKGLPSAKRV